MHDVAIGERYNNADYLESNPDWGASDSPWKARQVAQLVERFGLDVETVADVGCGAGAILEVLRERWPERQFTGFELSQVAHEMAQRRARPGLDYRLGDVTTGDERFDLMLCLDVFEHVENSFAFLRALRDKAEWHVFHIPIEVNVSTILRGRLTAGWDSVGHLHFYTRETALRTLQECGYTVVHADYTRPFAKDGIPAKAMRTRLGNLMRRLLFPIAPELTVRLIGGAPLIVLARAEGS